MLRSQHYQTQQREHLGLVTVRDDELGIGTLIDSLIPQDMSNRYISIGQAVKAMVLNGLGLDSSY